MNRLLQLLKTCAKAGGYFNAMTEETDEPEIYLYTVIGKALDWETGDVVGVSDVEFIQALEACGGKKVHLRVNSPGGDVFQMKAMQSAMARYPGQIVAHVDSLAASAAAGLIMYANEIEMSSNAFLLIHKAWTYCVGNADNMRDLAAKMDLFDSSLASDFARKTGMDEPEILELMAATTFLDAKTAKEKKFCDSVFEPEAKVENKFDLSIYGAVPEALRVVSQDDPQQDPVIEPYQCDRGQIERRLNLIERIAN